MATFAPPPSTTQIMSPNLPQQLRPRRAGHSRHADAPAVVAGWNCRRNQDSAGANPAGRCAASGLSRGNRRSCAGREPAERRAAKVAGRSALRSGRDRGARGHRGDSGQRSPAAGQSTDRGDCEGARRRVGATIAAGARRAVEPDPPRTDEAGVGRYRQGQAAVERGAPQDSGGRRWQNTTR